MLPCTPTLLDRTEAALYKRTPIITGTPNSISVSCKLYGDSAEGLMLDAVRVGAVFLDAVNMGVEFIDDLVIRKPIYI